MFRYFSKPIIPLLIINSALNQQKTVNLLNKLHNIQYKNAKAIAMVIEINNHMPVQVDKIAQFLKGVRQEHRLKIYGFGYSQISAESYYLLSIADQLYTIPSTILQLKPNSKTFFIEPILQSYQIGNHAYKSNEGLLGTAMDNITSANTSKYVNSKRKEISQRLYRESIKNRKSKIVDLKLVDGIPQILSGSEGVSGGLVDKFGSYYDVLRRNHPECELRPVRLKQKISTRRLELLIASPIILILFFFKVLLKYTIILSIWLNHTDKHTQSKPHPQ